MSRFRAPHARRLAAALGAAALTITVAACGSDAGTAPQAAAGTVEDPTITIAVPASLNGLSAHVAADQGQFDAAGLTAEFVAVNAASEVVPAMLSKQVDIGMVDVTTTTIAVSKNVPIVAVAPNSVAAPPKDGRGYGNLLVAEDSDLTDLSQLEGRTVGLSGLQSQAWVDIRTVIDEAGADSSKVEFVEIPGPRALGALVQGQVDVAAIAEPRAGMAVQEEPVRILAATENPLIGTPSYMFVVSKEYLAKNPGTVAAFEKAILAANAATNSDRAMAEQVAAGFTEVPAEVLASSVFPTFGEEPLTADQLKDPIQRTIDYGLVTEADAPTPAELLGE